MGACAPLGSGRQSRLPIWRQRTHHTPGFFATQVVPVLRATHLPVLVIFPVEIHLAVRAKAGVWIGPLGMQVKVGVRTDGVAALHRLAAFRACRGRRAEPNAYAHTARAAAIVGGVSNPRHVRTEGWQTMGSTIAGCLVACQKCAVSLVGSVMATAADGGEPDPALRRLFALHASPSSPHAGPGHSAACPSSCCARASARDENQFTNGRSIFLPVAGSMCRHTFFPLPAFARNSAFFGSSGDGA